MCNFICPSCKSTHHNGCDVGTTTLMYFPPEYKDGVNTNPDRNTTTSTIHCLGCGKTFTKKSSYMTENIEELNDKKN